MLLESARFRGDPILERVRAGDQSTYLRFGSRGEHVKAVQFGLIDLGYAIPDGATGLFAGQTSAAVVQFKTDMQLVPKDPVVGIGTITALDGMWSVPFADRDEWLSGQVRPIPEFNFTRAHEFDRRNLGRQFTFHPLSAWVPDGFKSALLTGITELLDPHGSPAGRFTPSATWGVGPLDLYHCHIVVDIAHVASPGWSPHRLAAEAIHQRMLAMMGQADQAGPEGTPAWTAAYRAQLLAPGQPGQPSYIQRWTSLLEGLLATAHADQQTLRLLWHTFERSIWRPVEMGSDDPRRAWWNDVAPVSSGVTRTPFPVSAFGANVMHLAELAVLIDQDLVVTVLGATLTETAALVHLDKARIEAVI